MASKYVAGQSGLRDEADQHTSPSISHSAHRPTFRTPFPPNPAGSKRSAESMEDGERKRFRGMGGQKLPMESATGRTEAVMSGAMHPAPSAGTFRMHPPPLPSSSTRPTNTTAPRNQVVSKLGILQSRNLPLSAISGTVRRQASLKPLPSLRWVEYQETGIIPQSSDLRYETFAIGTVIWCGHHVTAQNPLANPERDVNFVQAVKFTICSKFRVGVVANIFQDGDILILPCATHENNDLQKIPKTRRDKYYMVLRDYGDHQRPNPTNKRPLDVVMNDQRRSFGQTSSICLTEGFTIKHNEKVQFIGELTEESIEYMLETLAAVSKEALGECRDRKKKRIEAEAARPKLIPKRPRSRFQTGSRA
ncbi:hypothetical protein PRZ48_003065 [Zasmidium cellare]|uniref:DUF6590 domain-containing protein n=1 Tax=Zasmidium cellare TaxID=395010 RepID=A0ABR0EUB5_ZASCE|nr:hypothetical protein PRZ48_003065 [Zasmidium cellare]